MSDGASVERPAVWFDACPHCGHHMNPVEKVKSERWGEYDWEIVCSSSHCRARMRIVADGWSEQLDADRNPHIQPDQLYRDRLTQLSRMWNRRATPPAAPAGGEGEAVAYWVEHPKFGMELSLDPPNEDAERRGWVAKPLYLAAPAQSASGHDIEAAIERIISIRNGMTPDMEARAIVRRELAALGAPAQSNGDEGECTSPACERDIKALMEQCGDQFSEITALRDQLAKARAALEQLANGSFGGAATMAIEGAWQPFVDHMQAIARAALKDAQS